MNLVSLFSSTKYNQKTDEYGWNDENRARFILEIYTKISQAIEDEMIISAKLDWVNEEHGYTENGFITIAKALEKAGLDIMEVSGPNPHRSGNDPYFYEDTKKIADILKIPIICIGGIKIFEQVNFILKNSNIQYIAMSRELLKQPDLVTKWKSNK